MIRWKRPSTAAEKRDFVDTVTPMWITSGDLRLGQLIYNAVGYWLLKNKKPAAARNIADSIFYTEEEDLLLMIELFVKDHPYIKPSSTF